MKRDEFCACTQVEMVSDPPGKFPHLGGGLTVVIDSSQTAGQRIVALQHLCANISDSDTAHLATNDFVGGARLRALIQRNIVRPSCSNWPALVQSSG